MIVSLREGELFCVTSFSTNTCSKLFIYLMLRDQLLAAKSAKVGSTLQAAEAGIPFKTRLDKELEGYCIL